MFLAGFARQLAVFLADGNFNPNRQLPRSVARQEKPQP